MLQIFIYGNDTNGWLDVDPETVLDLEETAEAFDENLSVGTFSLPVNLPWSENNRKLLGFAERLENFSKMPKQFKCDVYDDGFPELIAAKLSILEKNGTFSYSTGSFSASIAGSKGLFGGLIKNKSLKDLNLDGIIRWTGKDSREFAYDVMTGAEPNYPQILFAPVGIENFIVTDRPDYANEFLAKDTVNNIVINASNTSWTFGRPQAGSPNVAAPSGTSEYIDYRTIPFYKLKFVLKKCFEEFNFSVSGDFIDNTDFDDLVIFNNYAIEKYPVFYGFIDLNQEIIPKNHMPDIKIVDFLVGVFALLNIYPSFENAQEVKLIYRKTLLTDKQILSLNEVVDKVFNASFENEQPQDGYTLDYEWDGNDQYYSDRVKDLKDKVLVASVRTFADLATLNIGRQLTTNDYAYVEADNMYYLVANATSNPILWDAYAEALDKYVVGNGEKNVEIKISPLCTYVEFDAATALYKKRNYVGTRQPGSYINNKNTLVSNPFGLRIFYIKILTINGLNIPVSFTHNRTPNNDVIVPYSLAFSGDYGIAKNFHTIWQEAMTNAQIVKTNARADFKVLNELQTSNCVEIDSILYLTRKKERTVPNKGIVKLHLQII